MEREAEISSDTGTGRLALLERSRSRPFGRPGEPPAATRPAPRLRLELRPDVTFEAADLAEFAVRLRESDRPRIVAPPLHPTARVESEGVRVSWEANPLNVAAAAEAEASPLLRMGVRVFRWRVGEVPAVIADDSLQATSILDRDLGPRGGKVFYSVMTVLEGRIGDKDTLIESERSAVLTADVAEGFTLKLVAGDAERATVDVTLTRGPSAARSERFDVAAGDAIGGAVASGAAPVDFSTGLVASRLEVVADDVEQVVEHPVFNPDGSRARDASGFVVRTERRRIPVRRLELACTDPEGNVRTLTFELP